MNRRIPVVISITILIVAIAAIYLEQGRSNVATVDVPIANVTQPASHAPSYITVTTDKPSYSMGDAISISGNVRSQVAGTPVFILILDPNNLLLQTGKILVSPDGSYQTTVMTTPSIWKLVGTYSVSAQYGDSDVKAQKTFYFAD